MSKSPPSTPKLAFASDTTSNMSLEATDALNQANAEKNHASYGCDRMTQEATELICSFFELSNLPTYYMPTGTACNSQALAAVCATGFAIVASSTGHVLTDERGAPHAATGNAMIAVPENQGLMKIEEIPKLFKRSDPHFSRPAVVTITQSSELGTVYKSEHYTALRELKRKHKLLLHLDGSRFGNALAHLNARPKDLTWLQDIDLMTLGFNKNGGGIGEAVIFFNEELAHRFDARQKQSQHLVAKNWILTAPIVGLLRGGEYLRNAKHANAMALHLAKEIKALYAELDGDVEIIAFPVEANAVFVKFSSIVLSELRHRGWAINDFIGGYPRLMCSWSTTEADIQDLLRDLREILDNQIGGVTCLNHDPHRPVYPARSKSA